MKKSIGIVFWMGLTAASYGQTVSSSAAIGTSGAWLELPSSVRAEGLAEAYAGVADDLGSININPAGLGQLRDYQINLMHNSWVQGAIEEQLRLGLPMFGGMAEVGFGYLNGGNVDQVGVIGGSPVPLGTFQPNAMRLDLGFGKEVIKDWYFGVSGTLAEDTLVVDSHWGGIGNVGILGKLGGGFRAGLSLLEVGGLSSYSTPAQWRLGISYETDVDGKKGHWLVSAEGGTLFTDTNIGALSVGMEYLYHDTIAIRLGEQLGDYGGLIGLVGFSAGAGVKLDDWELDYAFVTRGDLGSSNLISFNYIFEKEKSPTPTPIATAIPTVSSTPVVVETPAATLAATSAAQIPTVITQPVATSTPAETSIPTTAPAPITVVTAATSVTTQVPTPKPPKFYTVASGDSLWNISKKSKIFSDPSHWPVIFKSNRGKIKNPNIIRPDQILTVPEDLSGEETSNDHWWEEPFNAALSFNKLKTELVPKLIADWEIIILGQEARTFFKKALKQGVKSKEYAAMRSGYYSAVASALIAQGQDKEAAFYLDLALRCQPDNPDALALKAKIDRVPK